MAQSQTIRWRYRVEAVLVRLLKRCAVALPPRLTSRVGEGVGVLLYGTRAKLRYVRRNLRIAFPNLSAEQRRAIAAGNYRFFGAMLGEFLALGSLTREQVQEAVRLEDRAVLDAALARGKGVVLVTGHFGHWELLGAAVAHAGYPISAFVGGQENPLVDAVLNETREAFGVQTLGRDAGGRSLLRTLRAGFTTVRDVGDLGGASVPLRNAIASGLVPGPRMLTAREMLSITGGHGDGGNHFRPDLRWAGTTPLERGICDSPDACREAVRYQVKYGADLIKICATGGVLSSGDAIGARQFSDDELRAIVSEAHALGRKVAAHAHGTDGIKAAVLAGVDSIEHGSILDGEAIRLMKEHGTYLVPTLMAGETVYNRAREGQIPAFAQAKALALFPMVQASFRKAVAARVKVAFGTDSAVSPHGENAHEFELMVAAGMTPMEAIVAATRTAADLLGLAKDVGTVEPGKFADLVAVDGDPLESIAVLRKPVAVIKEGTPVDLARPSPPPGP